MRRRSWWPAALGTSGVTVDYNAFGQRKHRHPQRILLGGHTLRPPIMFSAATGQGAHDIITGVQPAGSTLIDSANADAPGELTTDIDGNPRVDDPNVANSGAGTIAYADRGDTEAHDAHHRPRRRGRLARRWHGAVHHLRAGRRRHQLLG